MSAEWPVVSLGVLIRLERRPVEVIADREYPEIGIYCFGRGIFHKTPRSGLEVGDKNLYQLRKGDLILQVTFAWEGAIALCGDAEEGLYGSTRYPTFRVNEDRCFGPFIAKYLCTPNGLDQINKICPGSAGRNRVLSIKRIPEIRIPLPPMAEQRRIVARIEKLAGKITETRSLRYQAAEQADALWDAASRRTFSDVRLNRYVQKISAADLRINEKSRDPVKYYSMGQFAYVDISSVQPGPRVINTGNVIPANGAPSRARRVIRKDDIIFSTVRPNLRSIAKVGPALDDQMCSTGFAVVSCGPSILPDFLLYQFCSSWIIDQCVAAVRGGHYPAINDNNFQNINIVIPPMVDQHRMVAELREVLGKMNALKQLQAESGAELDALLPAILDRAFKGEL